MKNKLNIIQINGLKGLLFLGCAIICLIAGFIVFPGIVMKSGWNLLSSCFGMVPSIGVIQGILLWGIIVVGFYALGGKKSLFFEFKTAEDLTKSELDEVMSRIKHDRQADLIRRSMLRAKMLEMEAKKELSKKLEQHTNGIFEKHIDEHIQQCVENKKSEIK